MTDSSNRNHLRCAVTISAALTLAGCASAPMSMLHGEVLSRAATDLYPVSIVSIDGSINFEHPARIAPGVHTVILTTAPVAGMRVSTQKAYAMRIEPCTRYYLVARRATKLSSDWEMVIERTEPIGGCNRDEELKKANQL